MRGVPFLDAFGVADALPQERLDRLVHGEPDGVVDALAAQDRLIGELAQHVRNPDGASRGTTASAAATVNAATEDGALRGRPRAPSRGGGSHDVRNAASRLCVRSAAAIRQQSEALVQALESCRPA
jgi:hypothetical protein